MAETITGVRSFVAILIDGVRQPEHTGIQKDIVELDRSHRFDRLAHTPLSVRITFNKTTSVLLFSGPILDHRTGLFHIPNKQVGGHSTEAENPGKFLAEATRCTGDQSGFRGEVEQLGPL